MNIELDHSAGQTLTPLPPPNAQRLRGVDLCQTLHWLAQGRISARALTQTYCDAIAAQNAELNAYVQLNPLALEEAEAADVRRARGKFGRLDGVPIAIKDNLDVKGLSTACGLPGAHVPASADAYVVERLRGAGAIVLGKAQVPEASLNATSANPHVGAAHNPMHHGYQAGGSSAGCAVAVAAGLAAAAIGTDTLGSIRIPASYCGVYALKPTHGEISTRGMIPAARRLDAIGLMARSVSDLAVLLHVTSGYDAGDARSRRRRVALAPPDWEPGNLRVGVLGDLDTYATEPGVKYAFERALMALEHELGNRRTIDFGDFSITRARRAAFFMIEAEMLVTHQAALADRAHPISAELNTLLDYARNKSAADYAAADRQLDAAAVKARELFTQIDVLVTPTTPQVAFPLESPLPINSGDFTCFANLSGCPALTIPCGMTLDGFPVGLQFIGAPGSDLRLLELAEVCAAALDATPAYPTEG